MDYAGKAMSNLKSLIALKGSSYFTITYSPPRQYLKGKAQKNSHNLVFWSTL